MKSQATKPIIPSPPLSLPLSLRPRLKALQERLDALEGQLAIAERAAASSEAQRKAMLADKGKFQKQAKVCAVHLPLESLSPSSLPLSLIRFLTSTSSDLNIFL